MGAGQTVNRYGMNKLKKKLAAGHPVFGTHVTLADPTICDMLGRLGYDYIWIDTEHSYISLEMVLTHIMVLKAHDVPAIVRVPKDDCTYTKKILEMGVDGIVFPMVGNAEHANRLIASTLYPPDGTRGFGPMRALGYGMDSTDMYIQERSKDICRFIQIETEESVEDIEKIVKNPWLDGCIFGPCDLSGQVAKLNELKSPRLRSVIMQTAEKIRCAGKTAGLSIGSTDKRSLCRWYNMGITMISSGSDYKAVWSASQLTLNNLRDIYNTHALEHSDDVSR